MTYEYLVPFPWLPQWDRGILFVKKYVEVGFEVRNLAEKIGGAEWVLT
jgi:hypothetical protein